MQRLPTIAAVEYLNTAPLLEGAERLSGVAIERAVPSRIAPMVASGAADLGLVSLVDAVWGDPPLALAPVGMIGCAGPTMTVRLFSRVTPDRIIRLHADTDSKTSVELARLLLRLDHGATPEVVPFDARERTLPEAGSPDEAWPEAVLLIGDKVVAGSPPAVRYPHQIDLGEAWFARTGLPFVYATWACLPERAADASVRMLASFLDRQRRRNTFRLDQLVSKASVRHGWPGDLARTYAGDLLRYELDEAAKAGLEKFVELCAQTGQMPGAAVRWLADTPGGSGAVARDGGANRATPACG